MRLEDALRVSEYWLFGYPSDMSVGKKGEPSTPIMKLCKPEIIDRLFEAIVLESKEPTVCVKRDGSIIFNECAKRFEIEEEIRDAIEVLIIHGGFEELPATIVLTNSLRTLAELDPDKKLFYLRVEVQKKDHK